MFDDLNPAAEHLYPQEQSDVVEQPAQQSVKESSKESNLRILRERAEAAERRALELERMIQNQNEPKPISHTTNEDDDIDIPDDSYVEGRQVKKYINNLKRQVKATQEQFDKYNQQNSLTQAEIRLKSQFSDFDNVVSKENIQKLAELKPALHRTIFANNDIYDRGYAAYELIKSSGILPTGNESIDRKLEENKSKPRSMATASPQTSNTPLTRVGDYDRRVLTEERKDQLRRQVEEAKRNL